MMGYKKSFYLSFVFALLFLTHVKAQYCTATFTNPCQSISTNDFVNNFSTTNGVTNITNLNSGCNNMPNNYIYYSAMTVTVSQGCSFNFAVKCGATYEQGFRIWIDYNHNNSFLDAGEAVWTSVNAGFNTFNGAVNIPATALTGVTRMRVRSNYSSPPTSPCASQTYGEVEDYNIDILPNANIPPVGVNDTICAGQSGSVTATALGNLQWFSVPTGGSALQFGGTLNTPVLNVTTTYYVQSVVGTCVSPRTPVKVVVIPAFIFSITTSQDTVCSGSTTVLTASDATYTYVWSPGASLNQTTGTSVTATLSSQTTYSAIATNAAGCTASASKTIYVHAPLVFNATVNPINICQGDTATISITGGYNYLFDSYTNLTTLSNDSVYAHPLNTANYTITATNVNGCTATEPVTVAVNALPIANAGVDENVCSGATVSLNASGGVIYTWLPLMGLSANNINNPVVTILATTSYQLTVTDGNGCKDIDSVTVNYVPLPVANPGANVSICPGSNTVLNGSGGTTYSWSPAIGLSNAAVANPTCTPLTTTNYVLTVAANGCTSLPSLPVMVTVFNQPSAPLINVSGPITFCQGNSVTLTSSIASNNVWSTGATANSIVVTASGAYTVYYVDANGCSSSVSAIVNVLVNPLPAAPVITPSGPTTICQGGTVNLTSSIANNYSWSTGVNTQSITVNSNGNFSVVITDANGCTATSASTTIAVNINPAPPIITPSGPVNFCTGDSVVLSTIPASVYNWSNGASTPTITVSNTGTFSVVLTDANGCVSSPSANTNTMMFPVPSTPIITPNGPLTFCTGNSVALSASNAATYLWNNGFTNGTITATTSGTYNVSIIDFNGCPSAVSPDITVLVNALPAAPIVAASGSPTFCQGNSIDLTSSQSIGNLWSNGSVASFINVSSSGTYTVTYTDANNCTSVPSIPVIIEVTPLALTPVIAASGPVNFCDGNNITLTCSPADSYLWSNGETTASIVVNTAGNYSVTITSLCDAINPTANKIITVYPNPVSNFTAPIVEDCLPSTISFINNSTPNTTSKWTFGDGNNSVIHDGVNAYQFPGYYDITLTVTDTNGCVNFITRNSYIHIKPPADVQYVISSRVVNINNAQVNFDNITTNTISQQWNFGLLGISNIQNPMIVFPDTGIFPFTLKVNTVEGCEEIINDSIIVEDNQVVFMCSSFTPNGDGLNDVFVPIGSSFEGKFKMEVYNRWGIQVYTTKSIFNPWDGGNLPQDNYIWKMYLTDKSGSSKEYMGSVTLLR